MLGPLIVLKFGGSVLTSPLRLRSCVHEISRWKRDGYRVVAVVSALHGRTDELIEHVGRAGPHLSEHAKASIIAQGEQEAASILGTHLARAGVPVRVLSPGDLGLRARGHPLDADPVGLDKEQALELRHESHVIVAPGYTALDDADRIVLLGRGGSDLSALLVARGLNADRCRLIKDVDGLYTSDPAGRTNTGHRPPRFARASYEDAITTDGSILQHKAVRYAQRHALTFEIGRINGSSPSEIAPGSSVFSAFDDRPRPLFVGLIRDNATTGDPSLGQLADLVLDLLDHLPELVRVRTVGVGEPVPIGVYDTLVNLSGDVALGDQLDAARPPLASLTINAPADPSADGWPDAERIAGRVLECARLLTARHRTRERRRTAEPECAHEA